MRKRKEGWKLDGSKGERGRKRGGREERGRQTREHGQAVGEQTALYISHVLETRGKLQPRGTELGVVCVLRCLG